MGADCERVFGGVGRFDGIGIVQNLKMCGRLMVGGESDGSVGFE